MLDERRRVLRAPQPPGLSTLTNDAAGCEMCAQTHLSGSKSWEWVQDQSAGEQEEQSAARVAAGAVGRRETNLLEAMATDPLKE